MTRLRQPKWSAVLVMGLMMSVPLLFLGGTREASAGDFAPEGGVGVLKWNDHIFVAGSTGSYTKGGSDIFLAKYEAANPMKMVNFVTWGYDQIGHFSGTDEATSMCYEGNTGILVAGYVTDSPPSNDKDVVVLKYNPDALYMHANFPIIFDNTGTDDVARGIVAAGNYIYIVGTTVNAAGDTDAMLLRYNTDGTKPVGWRTLIVDLGNQMNKPRSTDGINGVAVFGQSLFLAGYSDAKHVGTGNMDMVLLKVDLATGMLVKDNTWPIFWDGSAGWFHGPFAVANSIASDSWNSLYVTGTFKTMMGKNCAFIKKIDPSGTEVWATSYCPQGHETYGQAIAADLNRVYVTGSDLVLPFGQGQGQGMGGQYDVFVDVRETADGTYGQKGWTTTWDSGGDDFGTGICYWAWCQFPEVLVCGLTEKNSARGNRDALVLKYDQSGNNEPVGVIPNLMCYRVFGSSVTEKGNAVAQDGDFVYMVGSTNSYGAASNKVKTVNEDYYQVGDKYYYTGGADTDVFILKYHKQGGDPVWYMTYDGEGNDDCANAIVVSGDHLYIAGYTYSWDWDYKNGYGSFHKDLLLMKVDKNTGAILRVVTWDDGGTFKDNSANALAVYDQAIYVTGFTRRMEPNNDLTYQTIVVKYNLNLELQNFNPNNQNPASPQPYSYYSWIHDNYGYAIAVGCLNGVTRIFVAGDIYHVLSHTTDVILLAVDLTGKQVFAKTYYVNKANPANDPQKSDGARGMALRQSVNGRFDCLYIAGFTEATANGLAAPLVFRMDFDGNVVWSVADKLNDQNAAAGYSVVFTDNIYVVGAQAGNVNNWDSKAVIMRYIDQMTVDPQTGAISYKGVFSSSSIWGDSTDGAIDGAASITADDNHMYIAGSRLTTFYHPDGSMDTELTRVNYNGGWVWGVARLWG